MEPTSVAHRVSVYRLRKSGGAWSDPFKAEEGKLGKAVLARLGHKCAEGGKWRGRRLEQGSKAGLSTQVSMGRAVHQHVLWRLRDAAAAAGGALAEGRGARGAWGRAAAQAHEGARMGVAVKPGTQQRWRLHQSSRSSTDTSKSYKRASASTHTASSRHTASNSSSPSLTAAS